MCQRGHFILPCFFHLLFSSGLVSAWPPSAFGSRLARSRDPHPRTKAEKAWKCASRMTAWFSSDNDHLSSTRGSWERRGEDEGERGFGNSGVVSSFCSFDGWISSCENVQTLHWHAEEILDREGLTYPYRFHLEHPGTVSQQLVNFIQAP